MSASVSSSRAVNQLHASEARWFAVYTEYKREKLVAKMLRAKGVDVYLPLQRKTRRYPKARKVRRVELPLIPCYVFVRITRSAYVSVLETEYVLKFLKQRRDLLMVREEEIELLQMVIGEREVELEPGTLTEGTEVEIVGGELTGLRGVYLEHRSKNELTIELSGIGYLMHFQVDPKLVQAV